MSALGGVVVLRGSGMRSACKASSRRRDLGTFRGVYLMKRGCRGSRGLGSGRGGCGVGLAVEGAYSLQHFVWRVCIFSIRS